jgi:broad specificity phosphatase PhoE
MPNPPDLYFLRHGETFFNAEGRIQGQLDTPLSPRGREQAVEAGRSLGALLRDARLAPEAPGWFASPLSRTRETMTLAREAIGLPDDGFATDPRLMELNFGSWQDLTWPEIRARDAREVAARNRDLWNYTPPGGESYATLTERVRAWLAERSGPTVAVAHGGVARALMVLRGGLPPAEAGTMPVYQGRVLIFSNGTGRWA